MNRSLLLISVAAAMLATAACSKQEAASSRAADDAAATAPDATAPGTPTDGTTMPDASSQSQGTTNPDGSVTARRSPNAIAFDVYALFPFVPLGITFAAVALAFILPLVFVIAFWLSTVSFHYFVVTAPLRSLIAGAVKAVSAATAPPPLPTDA